MHNQVNLSRSRQYPHKPKRHFGRRFIQLAVIVVVILGAVHLFHSLHTQAATSPLKAVAPKPVITAAQTTSMTTQINNIISSNSDVDIAVSIIELNSGKQTNLGLPDVFEAASVGKLITATDFLHHVETNDQSLTEPVGDFTAQQELQKMIVDSDNDAWAALNDTLGHPDLLSYANSVGITDYDPDANTLTARDISSLLQKLYSGQLLNKADTNLLLSWMAVASENNYIGPVVPKGVKFYHKTGLLDDRVHDAAIIDNGKSPIVLTVFTREDGDEDYLNRAQIIQSIAKVVFKTYNIN